MPSVKPTFKMLYEIHAVSLLAHLLTPVLLAARGITAWMSHSHSYLDVYLFCVLPHRFSRKKEAAHSLDLGSIKSQQRVLIDT